MLNLAIFKDRNFAIGTFLMAMVGALLYASAIIVPQFAQQVLGYTATVSGRVLAPGGAVIICLIPLVGKIMGKVQIRFIIAFGLFVMGTAMFYSAQLVPTTNYSHLVEYRIFQTAALAFLFVPISTIAYSTLPKELNSDASAMFSMSRNYVGSLAISFATAAIIETQQKRGSYLVHWMTPYQDSFNQYLDSVKQTAIEHGLTAANAQQFAEFKLYQTFRQQVSMLAYNETFMVIGVIALCTVPICFLFSPTAQKGGGGAGH